MMPMMPMMRGDALFISLRAHAEAAELGPEASLAAWELVRACGDLASADARAFAHLVLATFVALRDGSTYLPLDKAPLADHLRPLALADAELRAAAALAAALRRGATPAALAPVIGVPASRSSSTTRASTTSGCGTPRSASCRRFVLGVRSRKIAVLLAIPCALPPRSPTSPRGRRSRATSPSC